MRLEDCLKEGFLRKHRFPPEVMQKELENAEKHLANAKKCIESEMYDLASVSIYTSMFHAARAILFRDGFKERNHVCVIAHLRKNYPALREHLKVLDSYRRARHSALYGIDAEEDPEEAVHGIELAEEFILEVKKILEI